ncbi:transposase family protein [Streptomyces sp. NPDC005533]|uniref:transposase family protein n=1 Tax=Streptomyces sp. NPDC005533 TaxID=3364723 RepID=UPI0036843FB1
MPVSVLSCSVAPAGDTGAEDVDLRDRRGRRYPLPALVRAAACAVATGARSSAAIGHWLRRAPQDTLARLGFPVRGPLGLRPAASMGTVRRIIEQLHPDGLSGLLRPVDAERAGPTRLAADGKSARGSRTRTRTAARLLAVFGVEAGASHGSCESASARLVGAEVEFSGAGADRCRADVPAVPPLPAQLPRGRGAAARAGDHRFPRDGPAVV